jgi:hypothetical protein
MKDRDEKKEENAEGTKEKGRGKKKRTLEYH